VSRRSAGHIKCRHLAQMRLLLLPGAVELRNEVSRAFGLELPGTLVYDYPTSSAIAAFLSARVDPAATTVLQMAGR